MFFTPSMARQVCAAFFPQNNSRSLLPRTHSSLGHNCSVAHVSILGNNGPQFGKQLQQLHEAAVTHCTASLCNLAQSLLKRWWSLPRIQALVMYISFVHNIQVGRMHGNDPSTFYEAVCKTHKQSDCPTTCSYVLCYC